MLTPIAHTPADGCSPPHLLDEHLRKVGELAASFAAPAWADWARQAGRWHDLGKYDPAFQDYIRRDSGYEAHLLDGQPSHPSHSLAGAQHALLTQPKFGRLLAYLIAGHHTGLPDGPAEYQGAASLSHRLAQGPQALADALRADIPADLLAATPLTLNPQAIGGKDGLHLWLRLVFSCLVDADFLDSEAYFQPEQAQQRRPPPDLADLRARLDAYLADKHAHAAPSAVNSVRADVLRQCREQAQQPPGCYTLTVPTGGGKTLSSLAFALEHALAHGKRRVIYAIPYTSIIEQTAEVFRAALGDDAVLEHHSSLDVEHETVHSRLAAENWDASVIVTTNVQLFESLFAARTSRCRKLHRLVDSVIVLDEAQLLPIPYLQPLLDALRLLTEHYGVTLLLCTATQPALHTRSNSFGHIQLRGLDARRAIIQREAQLYQQLARVRLHLPADLDARQSWADIARQISQHPSVLVIVNTRRHCRELHALLPEGTFHLSALMCAEHRSQQIADIRQRLARGEPVRVVSTTLIEAGVDVDFPVVFRALAGLDSIAQAAGRCNREGRLPHGDVHVFVPPDPSPLGWQRAAEEAARTVLGQCGADALAPDAMQRYFNHYYGKAGQAGFDREGLHALLTQHAGQGEIFFRTAAERMRLIDNTHTVAVIVPYTRQDGEHCRDSHALRRRLQAGEMHRDLLRQLQRFTVSLPQPQFERLRRAGELEEIYRDIWWVKNDVMYDEKRGLLVREVEAANPEQLLC